jgi:hypothetical protein
MLNWRAGIKSAGSPKFREAEAKAVEAEVEGEDALNNAVEEAAVEMETGMVRNEISTPSTASTSETLLVRLLTPNGTRFNKMEGLMLISCEVADAQEVVEKEEEGATMMPEGVGVAAAEADGKLPRPKSTEMRLLLQKGMAVVVHEMVPALEEEHMMNDSFAV